MTFDELHVLPPGTIIGNYLIERTLGQGGFGITYLARHALLNRLVAAKEYFPLDLSLRDGEKVRAKSSAHERMFVNSKQRFLEEAQTLARFQHPNIVRVVDFFEANGTAYMLMDYEEGESLGALLKGRRTLEEEPLLAIALPLLSGLAALHGAGIIHRDIKPPNIYLRKDGSPVLLDFGAAREAMGVQTKTLTAMLTPGYAPFEQYYSKSDRQGPWSDVYAMGAVLYRATTGKVVSEATLRSDALLRQDPDPMEPAITACGDRYSPHFLAAIDKSLQVLETHRPQSALEFATLLLGRAPPDLSFGVGVVSAAPAPTRLADRTPAAPAGPASPATDRAAPAPRLDPAQGEAETLLVTLGPDHTGPVSPGLPPFATQPAGGPTPARGKGYRWVAAGCVALIGVAGGGWSLYQRSAHTPAPDAVRPELVEGPRLPFALSLSKGPAPSTPPGTAAVEEDGTKPVESYRDAALKGNVRSQYNMGLAYEKGRGVQQDYVEAAKWYRLAADLNYIPALSHLGLLYDKGLGVPQSDTDAAKWFIRAAARSDVVAQVQLIGYYAEGRGVTKNLIEAYKWVNVAAPHVPPGADALKDLIHKHRMALANELTPDQLAESEHRAEIWVPLPEMSMHGAEASTPAPTTPGGSQGARP